MKRVIVSTISGHSNILDEILYDLTADYFEEFRPTYLILLSTMNIGA